LTTRFIRRQRIDPLGVREIEFLDVCGEAAPINKTIKGGRPRTAAGIRQLIREMSIANPLWGAPRMDGGLRKLGGRH
jgi:hypothetical protein